MDKVKKSLLFVLLSFYSQRQSSFQLFFSFRANSFFFLLVSLDCFPRRLSASLTVSKFFKNLATIFKDSILLNAFFSLCVCICFSLSFIFVSTSDEMTLVSFNQTSSSPFVLSPPTVRRVHVNSPSFPIFPSCLTSSKLKGVNFPSPTSPPPYSKPFFQ